MSMKLFKKIKKRFESQEHLFYLFLIVLITPNIALCFTEPLPLMAKLCNVLLPFACYYLVMTLSRNCGRTFWLLFPFVFLGAFQLVLLYLFGQSIIAVDMFLNLMTTNPTEAMELLNNLLPAIVMVVILYVPALVLGTVSMVRKRRLPAAFISRGRRRALLLLCVSLLTLGGAIFRMRGMNRSRTCIP
ncbi:integral membrane protein [Bacteroides pyogenes JCM 10003]|uniref:Integral membrane protein n=1 Tax=Bacteroides pyogenes JCM 6292 TaxID=1235809 RepID=W4P5T7_9BACE|nr:integral membrane protein [Bacteroides pyogenes JCM 6292]GAE21463.1 integral membrane protein [Bacteroides pyogenes JCM 10003]